MYTCVGRLIVDAIPGQLIDRDCMLGLEYSGRLADGTRVMGIASGQALATSVIASERHFWCVPDAWTLAQAATVPVAYCTAYYALCIRGRLRPHESILIHSGAGGVGQAAIAVALSMGCTVYTTVSCHSLCVYYFCSRSAATTSASCCNNVSHNCQLTTLPIRIMLKSLNYTFVNGQRVAVWTWC
jgi:hypothetical protein